jgi:hypothetical protein
VSANRRGRKKRLIEHIEAGTFRPKDVPEPASRVFACFTQEVAEKSARVRGQRDRAPDREWAFRETKTDENGKRHKRRPEPVVLIEL